MIIMVRLWLKTETALSCVGCALSCMLLLEADPGTQSCGEQPLYTSMTVSTTLRTLASPLLSRTVEVNQLILSLISMGSLAVLSSFIGPLNAVTVSLTRPLPLACMLAAITMSLVATESLSCHGTMTPSALT